MNTTSFRKWSVLLLAAAVLAAAGFVLGRGTADPAVTVEQPTFEVSGELGERVLKFQGVWLTPGVAAEELVDFVEFNCSEKAARCVIANAALWKGRLSITPEGAEPVEWRLDEVIVRTVDTKPCRRFTVTADLRTHAVTGVTDNAPNPSPDCDPMPAPEFSRLKGGPAR